jgi:hypothetical protein
VLVKSIPHQKNKGFHALLDKLERQIVFKTRSCGRVRIQPTSPLQSRPTAPASRTPPASHRATAATKAVGSRLHCPYPRQDSAAPVATRTTQVSQTPRSANQWARATCTPHHGVALVVPHDGMSRHRLELPKGDGSIGKAGQTGAVGGEGPRRCDEKSNVLSRESEGAWGRTRRAASGSFTSELVFRHRTSPAFPPNCTREALPRHYPGCGVVMGRGTGQRRLCSSAPRGTRKTGAGYSTRHEVPDPRRRFLGQVLRRGVRGRIDHYPRVG